MLRCRTPKGSGTKDRLRHVGPILWRRFAPHQTAKRDICGMVARWGTCIRVSGSLGVPSFAPAEASAKAGAKEDLWLTIFE